MFSHECLFLSLPLVNGFESEISHLGDWCKNKVTSRRNFGKIMALEESKATYFHSWERFLEGDENNDNDKGWKWWW
jgi:hypothetical protein